MSVLRGIGLFGFIIMFWMQGCAVMDPFGTQFAPKGEAQSYTSVAQTPIQKRETLKVVTYNIKFGGGRIDMFFDCYGDREVMTREEVIANLDAIVAWIRTQDPDILFLQEVDVHATRSADIDQVQYILDRTALNYGVYASQWKSHWIPTHNLGHVNSGNAILSKYKLSNAQRIALPLIDAQDGITRYFYLKRNILHAQLLDMPRPLTLVDTHLSAYAIDDTKMRQIGILNDFLHAIEGPFIMGGDLNTLPPHSLQYANFSDDMCKEGDFAATNRPEEALYLMPLYDAYNSAIPLEVYRDNNSAHFSFTSNKEGFWTRKLDYIFSNMPLSEGTTHQNTMPLSDHAPLSAVVKSSLSTD